MEIITIREVINNEARKAGVQNSRIWSDDIFDNFPEKGEFVGWSVERFKGNPYLALHVDNGGIISVSFLQALAHLESKNTIIFKKVEKIGSPLFGKYTISNSKSINPNLSGDQSRIIARILNKKFTSEKVIGWIIPYGEHSDNLEISNEKVVQKDFFKITME